MEYISLESALLSGTEYVAEYFEKTGKEIQVLEHDTDTNTCFNKADITGLDPKQIVKAVYLGKEGKFYGFISPEFGTREKPLRFDDHTIKKIFRDDRKKAKEMMGLRRLMPVPMDYGTCTPFVPAYFFLKGGDGGDGFNGTLEKLYVYYSKELINKKVDISMGGYGTLRHKISAQTEYGNIFGCLDWKFNTPDSKKIELFTF